MPKQVDHDERRRAIADAAVSHIAIRGLARTRLVDVAAAAQCTTGAVGHYFGQSGATRAQVLRAAFDRVMEATRGIVAVAGPDGSIRDVLHQKLPLDSERLRSWRVWLTFAAEAATDPALAEQHTRYYAELIRLFVARCNRYAEAGAWQPAMPAEQLADLVIATIDGLATRVVLEGAGAWPPARQHAALAAMLDALGVPASLAGDAADEED